jgi:hypothetical protein
VPWLRNLQHRFTLGKIMTIEFIGRQFFFAKELA